MAQAKTPLGQQHRGALGAHTRHQALARTDLGRADPKPGNSGAESSLETDAVLDEATSRAEALLERGRPDEALGILLPALGHRLPPSFALPLGLGDKLLNSGTRGSPGSSGAKSKAESRAQEALVVASVLAAGSGVYCPRCRSTLEVGARKGQGGQLTVNWYLVLQVEAGLDEACIKRRFREQALLLHPDKNKAPKADEAFRLATEAFRVLSDKNLRASLHTALAHLSSFCPHCCKGLPRHTSLPPGPLANPGPSPSPSPPPVNPAAATPQSQARARAQACAQARAMASARKRQQQHHHQQRCGMGAFVAGWGHHPPVPAGTATGLGIGVGGAPGRWSSMPQESLGRHAMGHSASSPSTCLHSAMNSDRQSAAKRPAPVDSPSSQEPNKPHTSPPPPPSVCDDQSTPHQYRNAALASGGKRGIASLGVRKSSDACSGAGVSASWEKASVGSTEGPEAGKVRWSDEGEGKKVGEVEGKGEGVGPCHTGSAATGHSGLSSLLPDGGTESTSQGEGGSKLHQCPEDQGSGRESNLPAEALSPSRGEEEGSFLPNTPPLGKEPPLCMPDEELEEGEEGFAVGSGGPTSDAGLHQEGGNSLGQGPQGGAGTVEVGEATQEECGTSASAEGSGSGAQGLPWQGGKAKMQKVRHALDLGISPGGTSASAVTGSESGDAQGVKQPSAIRGGLSAEADALRQRAQARLSELSAGWSCRLSHWRTLPEAPGGSQSPPSTCADVEASASVPAGASDVRPGELRSSLAPGAASLPSPARSAPSNGAPLNAASTPGSREAAQGSPSAHELVEEGLTPPSELSACAAVPGESSPGETDNFGMALQRARQRPLVPRAQTECSQGVAPAGVGSVGGTVTAASMGPGSTGPGKSTCLLFTVGDSMTSFSLGSSNPLPGARVRSLSANALPPRHTLPGAQRSKVRVTQRQEGGGRVPQGSSAQQETLGINLNLLREQIQAEARASLGRETRGFAGAWSLAAQEGFVFGRREGPHGEQQHSDAGTSRGGAGGEARVDICSQSGTGQALPGVASATETGRDGDLRACPPQPNRGEAEAGGVAQASIPGSGQVRVEKVGGASSTSWHNQRDAIGSTQGTAKSGAQSEPGSESAGPCNLGPAAGGAQQQMGDSPLKTREGDGLALNPLVPAQGEGSSTPCRGEGGQEEQQACARERVLRSHTCHDDVGVRGGQGGLQCGGPQQREKSRWGRALRAAEEARELAKRALTKGKPSRDETKRPGGSAAQELNIVPSL